MTLLLRICFSFAAAALLDAAAVTGKVTLEQSKDRRVRAGRDYSSVVVWLEPAGDAKVQAAPRKAVIEQKDKTFLPHLVAVPAGSTVEFPNYDPIFHNAFSNFDGQIFDVGLYPPRTTRSVRFHREGIVRVFCNIHPAMSAVIVVLRTPYYDVTGADGAFSIRGVPPGEFTLKVFHERATEATLQSLTQRITVAGDTVLSRLSVSEAGYIAMPHKNKYGKDYPAMVSDGNPYPGGPR